jgi:hypothetical protein
MLNLVVRKETFGLNISTITVKCFKLRKGKKQTFRLKYLSTKADHNVTTSFVFIKPVETKFRCSCSNRALKFVTFCDQGYATTTKEGQFYRSWNQIKWEIRSFTVVCRTYMHWVKCLFCHIFLSDIRYLGKPLCVCREFVTLLYNTDYS